MKKISLLLTVLFSALFILAGCGGSDDKKAGGDGKEGKIIVKYTHGVGTDPSDPHQWVALKYKELAEKYTNGKVEVQIFPGGQLGSEQRGFQDVQNGYSTGHFPGCKQCFGVYSLCRPLRLALPVQRPPGSLQGY